MTEKEKNMVYPGSASTSGAPSGNPYPAHAQPQALPSAAAKHSLYMSDWKPPYTRKDWDRCSMALDGADRFLSRYAPMSDAHLVECVGWFDAEGSARIVVGDLSNGRRVIVRFNSSYTKTTFARWSEAR